MTQATTERRVSSTISRRMKDGHAVFQKRYLPEDWGATPEVVRARAKREVALLQQIKGSDLFGEALGVVQIESFDCEESTISTYEIEGASLDDWIHQKDKRSASLIDAMNCAGRWLRQFQSLPLTPESRQRLSTLDPDSMLEYCQIRLDSLEDYGYRGISPKERTRLLGVISRLDDSTAGYTQVWTHADYAPGNLMWDGTTLTPIDFAMARAGRPLEDACYLLHRLEMQKVYRPWIRWPTQQWSDAFLSGYGFPDAASTPAYRLLAIKNLICRLHTYARRKPSSRKQACHDAWVRSTLRRKLLAVCRTSEKTLC